MNEKMNREIYYHIYYNNIYKQQKVKYIIVRRQRQDPKGKP